MCYNNVMQNKSVYFIVIALIIGLGLGFFFGQTVGQKTGIAQGITQTELKYKPALDSLYPAPPENLLSISGTVQKVYGAEVTLEINDPNDYLPHSDGTPVKKLSVVAETYANTKISLFDNTKSGKYGAPEVTPAKLSDLNVGDSVNVKSSTNIRNATKFDAVEIDLIKY